MEVDDLENNLDNTEIDFFDEIAVGFIFGTEDLGDLLNELAVHLKGTNERKEWNKIEGFSEFSEAQPPVGVQLVVTLVVTLDRMLKVLNSLKPQYLLWSTAGRRAMHTKEMAKKGFHECIGFIDGTTLPLSRRPEYMGDFYDDCHGNYSLNLQAVCDMNRDSTPFSVVVLSSDTVGDLKEAIKKKKENDADKLNIWHAAIVITDDEDGKTITLSKHPNAKKLRPTSNMLKVFGTSPLPEETINVIVERPVVSVMPEVAVLRKMLSDLTCFLDGPTKTSKKLALELYDGPLSTSKTFDEVCAEYNLCDSSKPTIADLPYFVGIEAAPLESEKAMPLKDELIQELKKRPNTMKDIYANEASRSLISKKYKDVAAMVQSTTQYMPGNLTTPMSILWESPR
ncbi:hypothetical protein BCR41DRAFT_394727 [Lobosporangium transversale]|uniref:Crinkler effector protein N-terminal domain-containing protein n=1 Tax=Lobosporangium transversale TaxID=64571 RepID=A0A1Y2GTY5_9FUNG|nr:hypothetical protein BCR41DRAFT_394727 [Lobosporangium transversale]ORZ20814.1 hypothetical protein BCR41DRAFT_394727 [Lobosporangium transversale]|eukprot:XP_021882723.1 hypothetical protein BCR41DRAFT_394727 [Lobosporangium transversale]